MDLPRSKSRFPCRPALTSFCGSTPSGSLCRRLMLGLSASWSGVLRPLSSTKLVAPSRSRSTASSRPHCWILPLLQHRSQYLLQPVLQLFPFPLSRRRPPPSTFWTPMNGPSRPVLVACLVLFSAMEHEIRSVFAVFLFYLYSDLCFLSSVAYGCSGGACGGEVARFIYINVPSYRRSRN